MQVKGYPGRIHVCISHQVAHCIGSTMSWFMSEWAFAKRMNIFFRVRCLLLVELSRQPFLRAYIVDNVSFPPGK